MKKKTKSVVSLSLDDNIQRCSEIIDRWENILEARRELRDYYKVATSSNVEDPLPAFPITEELAKTLPWKKGQNSLQAKAERCIKAEAKYAQREISETTLSYRGILNTFLYKFLKDMDSYSGQIKPRLEDLKLQLEALKDQKTRKENLTHQPFKSLQT